MHLEMASLRRFLVFFSSAAAAGCPSGGADPFGLGVGFGTLTPEGHPGGTVFAAAATAVSVAPAPARIVSSAVVSIWTFTQTMTRTTVFLPWRTSTVEGTY